MKSWSSAPSTAPSLKCSQTGAKPGGCPCEHAARRPASEAERAAAARYVADLAAPTAVHGEPELDDLLPRAPCAQHLPRLACDEGARASARAVQPLLPPAGPGREREGDHVEGNGDPGDVQAEGAVQGFQAVRSLQDRDSRV